MFMRREATQPELNLQNITELAPELKNSHIGISSPRFLEDSIISSSFSAHVIGETIVHIRRIY